MSRKLILAAAFAVVIGLAASNLVNLANQVTGTLAHGHGGTDVTSAGSTGNVLRSTGTNWASAQLNFSDLAGSSSTSQTASQLTVRTCMILVGSQNGSALVSADVGPQNVQCKFPVASTIVEVDLAVDNASSTSTVQVRKRHCSTFTSNKCTAFTTTNLLSGSLAALSGGIAEADSCAKTTTSTTCYDGGTNSDGTVTVSTTAIAAGDSVEVASGTPDGTTKRYSIAVHYTVN